MNELPRPATLVPALSPCLIALLVAVAPGCRADDAPADDPGAATAPYLGPAAELGRLEPGDCPLVLPPGVAGTLECGSVVVPDRHRAPQRGIYRLPVAVLRRAPADDAPPPVVFLHGGPGGRLFAPPLGPAPEGGSGAATLAALDAIAPRADIVLFDQRGVTARTQPPECLTGLAQVADRDGAALRERLVRCVRAWERLPNNSVASMRAEEYAGDVETLRTALGIERWTLYASSYGARVALDLLARSPASVHAAVLDSPVPDGASMERTNLRAFAAALAGAISDCEADARCARAWPRFRDDVVRAPAGLDGDPVALEYPTTFANPFGDGTPVPVGIPQRAVYDGAFFVDQARTLLYSGTWTGSLPRLADAASRRDASFLRRAAGAEDPDSPLPAFRTVDPAELLGRFELQVSLPVNVAYRCNEYVPPPAGARSEDGRTSAERLLESLARARRPIYADLAPVCADLGVDVADAAPEPRAPIEGDAPVLVLAGGTDPLTSVADARAVAALVAGARTEVLGGAGHSPGIASSCGRVVARRFLEGAGADRAPREAARPACADAATAEFATDTTEAYLTTTLARDGVTLRFPLGWGEIQPGAAYARYVSQDLFLAQGIGRITPERFMEAMLTPLPYETASDPDAPFGDGRTVGRPRWLGARTANGVDWTLHQVERTSGVINRFATAEFGDRLGYVVLTAAPGVGFGSSIEDVLYAAVDGFEVD